MRASVLLIKLLGFIMPSAGALSLSLKPGSEIAARMTPAFPLVALLTMMSLGQLATAWKMEVFSDTQCRDKTAEYSGMGLDENSDLDRCVTNPTSHRSLRLSGMRGCWMVLYRSERHCNRRYWADIIDARRQDRCFEPNHIWDFFRVEHCGSSGRYAAPLRAGPHATFPDMLLPTSPVRPEDVDEALWNELVAEEEIEKAGDVVNAL